MGILGAAMVLLALYHTIMLPSGGAASTEKRSAGEVAKELGEVLLDFFRKKHIIYYIFFIVLYRFAEGFVVKIVPLFLKAPVADGGLGLDVDTIGIYYGTFGAIAFVLGSTQSNKTKLRYTSVSIRTELINYHGVVVIFSTIQ